MSPYTKDILALFQPFFVEEVQERLPPPSQSPQMSGVYLKCAHCCFFQEFGDSAEKTLSTQR